MNPSFENTLSKEVDFLNEIYDVFLTNFENVKEELLEITEKGYEIDKYKLLSIQNNKIFLREIVSPFGFSQCDKILESCRSSISGKLFYSNTHNLLIDRKKIIITKIIKEKNLLIELEEFDNLTYPISLRFRNSNQKQFMTHKNMFFRQGKINFSTNSKKMETGGLLLSTRDEYKKKLSDFFIDNKFTQFDKEECYLLCSGEDIVWIIGHRIDDRFKISDHTKKVYIAELF